MSTERGRTLNHDEHTRMAIDVLIPVYNAVKTIRHALESIQRQTIHQIRIVVVDDGSSDGTGAILDEIARGDDRIVLLRKENGGIVDALNLGLAHCETDLVARHDADDFAYPERLAIQYAYLRAHPECIAVSSSARHIDGAGEPIGTTVVTRSPDDADCSWIPGREPYLLHPFLMARRADLLAVGGYRHCASAEDSDLYWRLRDRGTLHNLTDVLGDYRMHQESISSRSILSGRLLSYGSQMGCISAMRRHSGKSDLELDRARLDATAKAATLEDFCAFGSAGLDDQEVKRLRLAAGMKLVEVAYYRPYELDATDCRFIRRSIHEGAGLPSSSNLRLIRRDVVNTAVRLVSGGRYAAAFALAGPLIPYIWFRAVSRAALPAALRARLQSLARRQ